LNIAFDVVSFSAVLHQSLFQIVRIINHDVGFQVWKRAVTCPAMQSNSQFFFFSMQ